MEIVIFVAFAAIFLAVLVVTADLTPQQRRGIILGVFFFLLPGIIGLWAGVFESQTSGYVFAACCIPSGAVLIYLTWIGVLPLTAKKRDEPDGGK
jgi:hypothetical protein